MLPVLLIVVWAYLTQAATQCPHPSLCVSVTLADGGTAIVTVASSYGGYASIGLGTTRMSGNAPTYVGYGGIASLRITGGHYSPSFVQGVSTVATPAGVSGMGGVTFSIQLPLSSLGGTGINAIYASGPVTGNPNSPSAEIGMHPVRGSFYLEVPSAPQPPTPPPPPTVPAASPPAAQSPAPPAVTTTVASTSETSTTSSSGSAATGASGTSAMGGGEFCYDTKNTFCVSGTKDNVKNTIEFTVTSTAKGWASIGTGQYMDKSTMFIGWKNGNDVIISQRRGQGHDQPITSSPPVFTKLTNTKNNATLLSFTFSVPVSNSSSSLISLSGANSFIFGLSDSAPSNPSDAATPSIPQHSLYGSFSMDFSKATVTSTVGIAPIDGRLTLLLIHGVAMFLAWAVVPPIAIFVARYLKEKWGHRWYLTHTALLVFGTGGLMVISLITVELQLAPGVTRFIGSSNHGILGTIVALVLYPLQCGLGWLSNKWFDPDRKAVPWWDQLHWWVGRSVVLLGIVNIHLGIVEYGGWVPWVTAFWIYIALVLVVGFWYFGEKRMGGVVHHIGKSEEGTEEIKL